MNGSVAASYDTRVPQSETPTPHCLNCGYNLTGICTEQQPSGACPECGAAFDRDRVLGALQYRYLSQRECVAVLAIMPALFASGFVYLAYVFPRAHQGIDWRLFTVLIATALLAVFVAGFVATQSRAAAVLFGRKPRSRAALWFVFALIELGLTAAYAVTWIVLFV